MRDHDRVREREEPRGGRSPSLVGVLLLVSFGAVFAAGIWFGQERGKRRPARDEDPFARLDGSEGSGDLTGEALVFHDALPVPSPPSRYVGAPIAPVRTVEAPSTRVVPPSPDEPDPADLRDSPAIRPPEPPAREPVPPGRDGDFTLHVASFSTETDADRFRDEMRREGHRAFVVRTDVEDRGTLYRVRIGPFDTLAEAQRFRLDFESKMSIPTFIVRREPPAAPTRTAHREATPEREVGPEQEDS